MKSREREYVLRPLSANLQGLVLPLQKKLRELTPKIRRFPGRKKLNSSVSPAGNDLFQVRREIHSGLAATFHLVQNLFPHFVIHCPAVVRAPQMQVPQFAALENI